VFIVKLNPAGSGYSDVVYSTYIGGNYEDYGSGIAIDSSGNAYVTGNTHSTDFPTTAGSVKTTNCDGAGGAADAFVVKLNASGSTAVFSTYLCGSGAGGSGNDYGTGIAADSSGNAYVIGYTNSGNFPITSDAVNTSIVGSYDTFVTKLNSGGSTVVYSTYYGGTSYDYANNIFLDSNGYVYITGRTLSTNLLTTAGAVNTSNNGVWDVFVFRLSTLSAPTVTAMAPGSGFNSGSVHIHNITGTNFQSTGTTTINLTKSGETNITATGVTWVSSTQLRSDFNILGKNPGSWGVTVTNPDGQSGTLSGGYTIGLSRTRLPSRTIPPFRMLSTVLPAETHLS
jgi:hypothetical protein